MFSLNRGLGRSCIDIVIIWRSVALKIEADERISLTLRLGKSAVHPTLVEPNHARATLQPELRLVDTFCRQVEMHLGL